LPRVLFLPLYVVSFAFFVLRGGYAPLRALPPTVTVALAFPLRQRYVATFVCYAGLLCLRAVDALFVPGWSALNALVATLVLPAFTFHALPAWIAVAGFRRWLLLRRLIARFVPAFRCVVAFVANVHLRRVYRCLRVVRSLRFTVRVARHVVWRTAFGLLFLGSLLWCRCYY